MEITRRISSDYSQNKLPTNPIYVEELDQNQSSEQQEVYKKFRFNRILFPVLISLAVFAWLFHKNFDWNELRKIQWTPYSTTFIFFAIGVLAGRVLSYALRLKHLSSNAFSLLKSIELIFIWEFSSAISPTNVGGSAVALFILSKEKIGAARTATIVVYTVILDAFFFISTMLLWFAIFGMRILIPNENGEHGAYLYSFMFTFLIMIAYGTFFFIGTFIKPVKLKKFSYWLSKRRWLSRYREQMQRLGENFVETSIEMKKQPFSFHLKAFLYTAAAWCCRFLLLAFVIIAIAQPALGEFGFIQMYARIQTLYIIMASSPTPGGAGIAEFMFSGGLQRYFPEGIGVVIASLWRLMEYYFFLLMGILVIPHWINKLVASRKKS